MKNNITERLVYLAKMFDVFEGSDNDSELVTKLEDLEKQGYTVQTIHYNENIIALLSTRVNEKERLLKKVSISSDIFSEMIVADPTTNKIYVQWMLTLFSRLIKDLKTQSYGIRLVGEDLPQANMYLTLFEEHKRKKKFKDLCLNSYSLKGVTDPTNINQYKTLSQVFDAVDPFIEKDPSSIERTIMKLIESGKALMPLKDRKFTIYIPLTTEASTIFSNYANWCTARQGNGMFKNYTEKYQTPLGRKSKLYIVINNKFFTNESDEIFQIHFETDQLKDRQNGQNVSIFQNVIEQSEGVANFFKEELTTMAKAYTKGIKNNMYLNYLLKFGFAESLFELIDENVSTIKFMDREIPRIPDISKFKKLDQIIITDAKLIELHPSIGSLEKLCLLVLTNNRLKELPKEIGNLQNLEFINLSGNKNLVIPNEISRLDKSNGGSLHRIVVDKDEIGVNNYNKLKELLPTTNFS
jgi:hypothetical protein